MKNITLIIIALILFPCSTMADSKKVYDSKKDCTEIGTNESESAQLSALAKLSGTGGDTGSGDTGGNSGDDDHAGGGSSSGHAARREERLRRIREARERRERERQDELAERSPSDDSTPEDSERSDRRRNFDLPNFPTGSGGGSFSNTPALDRFSHSPKTDASLVAPPALGQVGLGKSETKFRDRSKKEAGASKQQSKGDDGALGNNSKNEEENSNSRSVASIGINNTDDGGFDPIKTNPTQACQDVSYTPTFHPGANRKYRPDEYTHIYSLLKTGRFPKNSPFKADKLNELSWAARYYIPVSVDSGEELKAYDILVSTEKEKTESYEVFLVLNFDTNKSEVSARCIHPQPKKDMVDKFLVNVSGSSDRNLPDSFGLRVRPETKVVCDANQKSSIQTNKTKSNNPISPQSQTSAQPKPSTAYRAPGSGSAAK